MNARILRYLGPALGLSLFLVALVVLSRELHGERVRDVVRLAERIPAGQVGAALLFTVLSYLTLTAYDAISVRYVRRPVAYRRVALASFLNYAFAQTLGVPLLTGGSVRYRLYSGWGLSAIQVTNVIAFASVTFWLGVLAVGGVDFLVAPLGVAHLLALPDRAVRLLGVLALAVVGAYLWWTATGRRVVRVRGWRFRRPSPRLAIAQLAAACADWVFAAGVLYALLPRGVGLAFPAFLGVFLVAYVAGIGSNVPAGLGVFETVIVVLLPASAPTDRVLGALVVYRGVYHLLPLLAAATTLGTYEALRTRTQIRAAAVFLGRWVPALAPTILAVTTLLGGAILLASGATPSMHGRVAWLNDFLPLPIIEASHFLASLAGIGLVLLAAGLQRRLDAAYHLTVALLVAGIAFSLLKGLDYEEAIALAVMLAALLPSHRHFYRRSALLAEPFTPGWIAAVALVLAGTVWLGIFSYRRLDVTSEIWWRFAWMGDAPRFLRATVGATGVVLAVAVARLLRPVPPEPALPSEADLDRAAAIVATSPDTYASLALLGDKSILFSEKGDGFITYAVEGRSWVALADPVGPPEARRELAWAFRELADRHGDWTVFYLASPEQIPLYLDLGLTFLKLGEEALVPLGDFSLDGGRRKSMRRIVNAVERAGASFEVVPMDDVPPLLGELRGVSDAWLAGKRTREKRFSLGHFAEGYIRRFPAAVVRQEGRVAAFANVLPGDGREELSVDLMRFHPDEAPDSVMEYLLVKLMLWGREQGYSRFNLGMAPLSGLENRSLAPVWNRVGALVFRLGEHFYNFQGLRRYKEKFDPTWHPRYLASPGGLALPRIITNVATLISGGVRGVVAK